MMKRPLALASAWLWLTLGFCGLTPAIAADQAVSAMPAATTLGGGELLYCVQSGTSKKCTVIQTAAYVFGIVSGDMTCTALGACTVTKTNGVNFAASATTDTTNAANIGSGTLPIARVQNCTSAQRGACQVDGTTITESSGVISAAPLGVVTRIETGANAAIPNTDRAKVVYLSNASNQVPTIAQAGTGGFIANWFTTLCNINAGTQTLTPATSTIGGAASYAIPAGSAIAPKCVNIISDGTNYTIVTQGAPLNGANIWTARNTFNEVVGAVTTQSGTTYTLAQTDCGTLVRFTNGSAVTVTIPQGLTVGCNIAIMQAGAGAVSVNGSAVTPATLQSRQSFTKTAGAGAIIGLSIDASNHAILTGDGAT